METEIDPKELITVAEAAKLMRGRWGKSPHVDTVRRWANPGRGCQPAGREGPRLVLMTTRDAGGGLATTARWVESFEQARLQAGLRGEPERTARPPARRAAAHRRAEARLDAAGVGTPKQEAS